jgi:alpha-galactosidase
LNISLDLKDLQINGPVSVRDLWRQEDLGPWEGKKSFLIPHHGVYLFKISPLNTK